MAPYLERHFIHINYSVGCQLLPSTYYCHFCYLLSLCKNYIILRKRTGCAVVKEIISKVICLNHFINLFSLCLSIVTNYVSNSVNVNLQISKLHGLYCTRMVTKEGQWTETSCYIGSSLLAIALEKAEVGQHINDCCYGGDKARKHEC